MKTQHTFINRGRTWQCIFNKDTGHWEGISPDMVITAASWDDLKEELSTMDLSQPRQDGVAVCHPISMGAFEGF